MCHQGPTMVGPEWKVCVLEGTRSAVFHWFGHIYWRKSVTFKKKCVTAWLQSEMHGNHAKKQFLGWN